MCFRHQAVNRGQREHRTKSTHTWAKSVKQFTDNQHIKVKQSFLWNSHRCPVPRQIPGHKTYLEADHDYFLSLPF